MPVMLILAALMPALGLAEVVSAPEAETVLHGQVSFGVSQAREESFNDLPTEIDPSGFPMHDPNFNEHLRARVEDITQLKGKVLTYFDNGAYAVYTIGSYECYYYNYDGSLFKVGVSSKPRGLSIYPNRDVEYNAKTGKMKTVGLYVSREESYVFNPDGELTAHWQGHNAYNQLGEVIMSRSWETPKDFKQ